MVIHARNSNGEIVATVDLSEPHMWCDRCQLLAPKKGFVVASTGHKLCAKCFKGLRVDQLATIADAFAALNPEVR